MPALTPPTFEENLAIQAYSAAKTGALTAADGLANNVVTVAFAVGAAYGGLVSFVVPKAGTPTWALTLPFLLLAVAIVFALASQVIKVGTVGSTPSVEAVESAIRKATKTKNILNGIAVVGLVVSLLATGAVVAKYFRGTSTDTPEKATAKMNKKGVALLSDTCGRQVSTVVVDASTLTEAFVLGTVDNCPTKTVKVLIPAADVVLASATG